MNTILCLAVSPTLIILCYIYIRDKYEKEPLKLLFLGVLFGVIVTAPIVFVEQQVMKFAPNINSPFYDLFRAFFVASLVEEFFKFLIVYFLTWRNRNFNEYFDGIVYATFVSLGFAGIENLLYVTNEKFGGIQTAIGRGIISVPAHALFGVFMGYYLAFGKFHKKKYIIFAFVIPFLMHGIYDTFLFINTTIGNFLFIIFLLYLWISGFKKMHAHLERSIFKK